MATLYPAPNALLPSNVYMSEKTLDGCAGQCLGTSSLSNARGLLFAALHLSTQGALAVPPRAPMALFSLTAAAVVLQVSRLASAKPRSAVVAGMDPASTSLCM